MEYYIEKTNNILTKVTESQYQGRLRAEQGTSVFTISKNMLNTFYRQATKSEIIKITLKNID